MLRINDVIELTLVSRKTIYNAINTGRLRYELVKVGNRQVRMFHQEAVFSAFPKTKRNKNPYQEMEAMRKEIDALKFALSELQKAVEVLDPSIRHTMTSASQQD